MKKNSKQTRTAKDYWRANLRLVAICLFIWFLASYVCGILLVDELNQIRFFGYKLGFWFAQQGSIYVFLILIFFYAWRMNRLDEEYGAVDRDFAVAEEQTDFAAKDAQGADDAEEEQ